MKYIGIAKDRLSGAEHKTRPCDTWSTAYKRAVRLAKRYFTDDRSAISVEELELDAARVQQ